MKKADEKKILERAILIYWSCKICEKLGWDSKCQDKTKCGERIYKLLEWHYSKKD